MVLVLVIVLTTMIVVWEGCAAITDVDSPACIQTVSQKIIRRCWEMPCMVWRSKEHWARGVVGIGVVEVG